MKNKIGNGLIWFAAGVLLAYFILPREVEEIQVPINVEVPVPVVEHVFDTIIKPVPVYNEVTVVDTSLVESYRRANDSLRQKLFEEAVTIRDYREIFEDSIQTITVDANVTGTLNKLNASYKTKPRTVTLDTTVTAKVPIKKNSVTLYVEAGLPSTLEEAVFKYGADFKMKNNFVIGASKDTRGTWWAKFGKTFKF